MTSLRWGEKNKVRARVCSLWLVTVRTAGHGDDHVTGQEIIAYEQVQLSDERMRRKQDKCKCMQVAFELQSLYERNHSMNEITL